MWNKSPAQLSLRGLKSWFISLQSSDWDRAEPLLSLGNQHQLGRIQVKVE